MPDLYLQILQILSQDANVPHESIAKQLAVDTAKVKAIIAELEQTKMILGYKAIINKEKVFEDKVFAVIEVRVSPERTGGFDHISKRLYQFPEVRSLYLMSGSYDLLIFIEGKNLKEVAGFVATKLSTIDRILHTATHFVLKTYKEDGIMLDAEAAPERLKVSP
ncbi:MAG: Lrp/AsnC family transcriptional regulator [Spirochaetes bacterium]|nr:Lrp/AsnC family transcriptional regulator [Spirochaetota bacterium]